MILLRLPQQNKDKSPCLPVKYAINLPDYPHCSATVGLKVNYTHDILKLGV
jgi:hypothetical protein